MSHALNSRQKNIITALRDLGGETTTAEIAKKLNLNANGVSQSLGVLQAEGFVRYIRGDKTKPQTWQLIRTA